VSQSRTRVSLIAVAIVGAAAVSLLADNLGDYKLHDSVFNGDNPAPTINALIHGHLNDAVHHQPLMGLFSILLRIPFAALANLLGGGQMLAYRLGIFPCALAVGLVGVALVTAARERGRSGLGVGLAATLLLANPMTADAIRWGHPEELLAAALGLGAVLAALHGRPVLAGACLGLALGTKEWTLVALTPTILALGEGRRRALVVAGVIAAPLIFALPLADPSAFMKAARDVGHYKLLGFGTTWWWLVADVDHLTVHVDGNSIATSLRHIPFDLTRGEVSWLIPLVSLPIGWAFHRRQGRGDRVHALGLLALVMLLRGTLDPFSTLYYYLPFLMALLAWETLAYRRLPFASLLATVGMWLMFDKDLWLMLPAYPATPIAIAFLVFTAGLGAYLAVRLFVRGADARSSHRPLIGTA
jgi:hypothetical protein